MATVLHRASLRLVEGAALDDYSPVEWIHNPDLSAVEGVPDYYWKIQGNDVLAMDAGERAAVDALRMPMLIAAKKAEWEVTCREFIHSHYAPHQQQTFSVLLSEARAAGLTNRVTYILQALGWVDAVLTYYYGVEAAIEAATTPAALDAVVWDFAPYDAADPDVSIRQARLLTT